MKKIIIFMLSVILLSCSSNTNTIKESANNDIRQKWELVELDGQPVSNTQPIYIDISEDGKVSGFVACNRLMGSVSIENGNRIHFDQLGTTRMACPEMDLETKIIEMLRTADNYTIDGNKMMLNVGRRAPLATFVKMSDNGIVNKYWKLKSLRGVEVKMSENQEKEQFFTLRNDGTFYGFAGCNNFSGGYEILDSKSISFGKNMAATMKICPGVENKDSDFFKIFEEAEKYILEKDVLKLNNAKDKNIAIFEAVYFD